MVQSFAITTTVGRVFCKGKEKLHCNEVLGYIVNFCGAFLPAIAAKAIVMDEKDSDLVKQTKKWDTIRKEKFFIEAITEKDLVYFFLHIIILNNFF